MEHFPNFKAAVNLIWERIGEFLNRRQQKTVEFANFPS